MIKRDFLITLPPYESNDMHPKGKNFPRWFNMKDQWPDWRCEEDYKEFDTHPVTLNDLFSQWVDSLEMKDENHELFRKPTPKLQIAMQKMNDFQRLRHNFAWAFLRRNVGYQRDWANWWDYRSLHQTTGKEIFLEARHAAAQTLREKYCIEAEKYKPPSPFNGSDPTYTFWIDRAQNFPMISYRKDNTGEPDKFNTLNPVGPYIDYRIFLDKPIDEQILSLKNELLYRQKFKFPRFRPDANLKYLRVLDALAVGASNAEIAKSLYPGPDGIKTLQKAIKTANQLAKHGYRRLAGDPSYSNPS